MFRYSISLQTATVEVDAGVFLASQSTTSCVPVRVGEVALLRQRVFKLEKLVPVVPTRFVLVTVPWCLTSDVEELLSRNGDGLSRSASSVGPRKIFSEINAVIEWIKSQVISDGVATTTTSPQSVFDVFEVTCDTTRGETLVVLDVGTSSRMVDVLEACDSTEHCAAFIGCRNTHVSNDEDTHPFALSEAQKRRLVAFPFDPRPLPHAMVQEEYYSIPTCMLCCDRLDRTISGIAASVCACPDDSCSCIFTSRCPSCRVACLAKEQPCTDCGVVDDTWACLLCGYLGCSRYRAMHVTEHCQRYSHDFSLSLTTQQIWDYQSDRFVHRLVLNVDRAAGVSERMQFPDPPAELESAPVKGGNLKMPMGAGGKGGQSVPSAGKVLVDAKLDAKLEQCCANYSRELAAHLATQRSHYMSALRREGAYESSRSSGTTEIPSVSSVPERNIESILESISQDLSSALEASTATAKAWVALQSSQNEVSQLERDSAVAESKQAEIKDRFRKLLSDDVTRKSSEEKQIRELEETISDLKLNVATKHRMLQKLGKGDQLGNTMAVLGGGSQEKKPQSTAGARKR